MSRKANATELALRIGLLALIYVCFVLVLPNYATATGIAAFLDGSALTGLVALGVALTMIAGELDLSVGSMAALAGVLAIELIGEGWSLPLAVIAVVAAAALVGALQGLAIHLLRINSLIFTVGTLIGIRGVALIAGGETTQTLPIDRLAIADLLSQRFLFLSPLNVILMLSFVVVGLFASHVVWGREIYAIGGGRHEARAAGVPIVRPLVIAFACSAGFAALGGALLSVRSGGASPLAYDSVLLEAIAACLIGGVALKGGRGAFAGIFVGLLTLRLVISGISGLGAPFWAQNLAAGLLLIAVIAGETISRAIGQWREHRRARRSQPPMGALP